SGQPHQDPRPPGTRSARPAPTEHAVPYPTSPDLGVRSLTSAELTGRRANGAPDRQVGAGLPRGGGAAPDGEDTLPPAPPGATENVRLSIFEELQSEWFTQHDEPAGAAGRAPWDSPADDGWRAAARLTEPTTAGTTTAGLPRRKPQALIMPGAVGNADGPAYGNGAANRSADDVRGRLSSYREGVRRGRHSERSPE
ncbi:MAG TPA: hypothetical protein VE547_22915, partial [Mycobacteriales bacterium]|nr:hypothetical protein [Mycobacteriales bacterium]